MTRLASNFVSGTLSAALTDVATTITSDGFTLIPAVVAPDFCWLVLDPDAEDGIPEIVKVTVHAASATTLTAIRGQQTAYGGSVARAHVDTMAWRWAYTADDFETVRADVAAMIVNKVAVTGDTMTGNLTMSGAGIGVILPAGQPSAANRAPRKDWVDTEVATRVATAGDTMTGALLLPTTQSSNVLSATHRAFVLAQDDLNLSLAGGTMTGALLLDSPQSSNDAAAIRHDYADGRYLKLAGGTMTGALLLDSPQSTNVAAATRKDYVDGNFVADTGDTMTGTLVVNGSNAHVIIGKSAAGVDNDGLELYDDGRIVSHLYTVGQSNLFLDHISSANVDNGAFVIFRLNQITTTVGSIRQVSTTGVAYNETSDYRLKNDLGPIVDALERVGQLVPRRITWKGDAARGEMDSFFAHEVADAAPYAVQGDKDAVDADGNIDPQQLDNSKLVPLLVAAVQQLTARIETLEGAST